MTTVSAMLRTIVASVLVVASSAPSAAEQIAIKGSNTFGEELGPHLVREYQKTHPDATIGLESKGSASGFAALLAGECDIASSSRPATEDEQRLARSRGIKLKSYTVGYYGVAVVVNEANPTRDLSDMQVRSVFTGIIRNWKALDWEDQPIVACIRDPVSGTYLGFQELAMDRMPYVKIAKMFKSYHEIAGAVIADRGGIGYVGMNVAEHKGLRALRINAIPPTLETVNEGTYPYARQLRFYTNARKESSTARGFIRFVQSKAGQQALSDMGFARRFEAGVSLPKAGEF